MGIGSEVRPQGSAGRRGRRALLRPVSTGAPCAGSWPWQQRRRIAILGGHRASPQRKGFFELECLYVGVKLPQPRRRSGWVTAAGRGCGCGSWRG